MDTEDKEEDYNFVDFVFQQMKDENNEARAYLHETIFEYAAAIEHAEVFRESPAYN